MHLLQSVNIIPISSMKYDRRFWQMNLITISQEVHKITLWMHCELFDVNFLNSLPDNIKRLAILSSGSFFVGE